jgi:hypothetical protein
MAQVTSREEGGAKAAGRQARERESVGGRTCRTDRDSRLAPTGTN